MQKRTVVLAMVGFIALLAIPGYFVQYEKQRIDFNTQIRPIINKKCISCHGGVKQSGGFSLLFPEEAVRSNDSGRPAIVPGKPEESELISRVIHEDPEYRMPLEGAPLSEDEIALLKQWIKEGAEWDDHWAFKSLEPVTVPDVSSAWVRNDIDRFVLKRLAEHDLDPSDAAEKEVLIRRVSLDLIGLPPSAEDRDLFLKDKSEDAYEKLVDRLLASPHFGERWTSMWMDLARYADSKGYTRDTYRGVWKYRDWLIKAFNDDKGYDEFITEQLAGDLLPNPSDEQLIATAFHRNTLSNDEGGTDDEEFRVAAVIDRVNTTWNALQGTTMECVQCHSHPYDPIRHEDFYKSYAFFNNTADEDTGIDSPNLVSFVSDLSLQKLEDIKEWVAANIEKDERRQRAVGVEHLIRITEPKIHGHSFVEITNGILGVFQQLMLDGNGRATLKNVPLQGADQMLLRFRSKSNGTFLEVRKGGVNGELLGSVALPDNRKRRGFETIGVPLKSLQGIHDLMFIVKGPAIKNVVAIEWVLFHESLPGKGKAGYPEVREKFFSLLNDPTAIQTPVMTELEGDYRRTTHVFERGNWLVHGEEVQPGVPEAWNTMPEGAPLNRLSLAQWMTNEDNPLTARVIVNRLWAQLFGIGIVETQEDFGSQGSSPSHPQLLDWLSQRFMHDHHWSMKNLLKDMVMSATYRQSSKLTPELAERDPRNQLLARGPRIRLTAEQLRDQILATSGLLSSKMFGPSVMPLQPDGIWDGAIGELQWQTSEGEDRWRRSLYTYWRRSRPYPSMTTFDVPSREFCVTRRINTNTPLQALVTLNDPVLNKAAVEWAKRMIAETEVRDVKAQIASGYRMAMVTDIRPEKLAELIALYEDSRRHFEDHPVDAEDYTGGRDLHLAALSVVANVMMNLDEFCTKS